ncbi:MAG: aspartate kinase [Planctomycetota bacterium]
MIVLKFGGTSVGGSDPIRRVGKIVQTRIERGAVVVVSAVGGITDKLFRLSDSALSGANWEEAFVAIRDQHHQILQELELEEDLVDHLLSDLHSLAGGIASLKELTARTRDRLVSFGERLSARIVAAHLRSQGVASTALDAFDAGLLTDSRFGEARPLPNTEERIREALAGVEGVPIITGYLAQDSEGVITTLGRGGSDYSASIFGAALGAEEIEIWTDVDGVLSADPRIVSGATRLEKLSFSEASELAFYGAKVIHPLTMEPAVRKNIPIRVLNTYRPESAGTTIVSTLEDHERGVKSITSKNHVSVVNVTAPRMLNQYGFVARIADVFKRHEVVLDMIATSEVSVTLTTKEGAHLEPVVAELEEFSEVNVLHDMAQVSVVGEEIKTRIGFAADVFQVMRTLGINVEMISFGATQINLSYVVSRDQVKTAVQGLHDHLFGDGGASS